MRPNHSLPVDCEGGRGLHPQLAADVGLVFYELGVLPRIEAGIEISSFQAHVGCKLFQVILGEGTLVLSVLMRKQVIVEIPKSALVTGALSRFSGPL